MCDELEAPYFLRNSTTVVAFTFLPHPLFYHVHVNSNLQNRSLVVSCELDFIHFFLFLPLWYFHLSLCHFNRPLFLNLQSRWWLTKNAERGNVCCVKKHQYSKQRNVFLASRKSLFADRTEQNPSFILVCSSSSWFLELLTIWSVLIFAD